MQTRTPVETLEAELTSFVRTVVDAIRPERIILYGSMATGEVHEGSDLDLVVVAETSLPYFERLRLVDEIVRSPIAIDVSVYTPTEWAAMASTQPFFRDEVVGKGHTVYESPCPTKREAPGEEDYNMDPVQPWIESAHRSLEAAELLYSGTLWPQTCFNAQQCAELALKAAIVSRGVTPVRTHNLIVLVNSLDPGLQAALQPLDAGLRRVNRYYELTRYPDARNPAVPGGLPGEPEATEALNAARDVVRIIDTALGPRP